MKIIRLGEWDDCIFMANKFRVMSYTKEEYKLVIDEIKKKGYKFSGDYHQNGDYGVPYFDNGIPFMVSQREWGSIMAAAWPEEIEKWRARRDSRKDGKYDYIAFAWYTDEMKDVYCYPTEKDYTI